MQHLSHTHTQNSNSLKGITLQNGINQKKEVQHKTDKKKIKLNVTKYSSINWMVDNFNKLVAMKANVRIKMFKNLKQ